MRGYLEIIQNDGAIKVVSSSSKITVKEQLAIVTARTYVNVSSKIPNNYGLITWNGSTLTVS